MTARISECINLSKTLRSIPISELVDKTKTQIRAKGYSRSTRWTYNVRFNDLKRSSVQFGTDRLTDEFIAWFIEEGRQRYRNHTRSSAKRKALLNVIAAAAGSTPIFTFESRADKILSKSFRESLAVYGQHLKDHSKSAVAIKSYLLIAADLLIFLEKNNKNDPQEITADDIWGFVTELAERWSPESMRSVPTPLRAYLRFAGAKFDAIASSSFSVPRKDKPIRAMSAEAVEALWEYIKGNEGDLRSKAIVVILLATGIRSVDIINLKLDDISWQNDRISFVQSKTGVGMDIELFPVMGNAIARYITEQRPQGTGQRSVFLSKSYPYHKIASSACPLAVKETLEKAGITYVPDGLHCPRALRRSLASRMIAKEVPIQKAACALGHVGENSVDLYLELDVEQMRSLCLPVPDPMKGWPMPS